MVAINRQMLGVSSTILIEGSRIPMPMPMRPMRQAAYLILTSMGVHIALTALLRCTGVRGDVAIAVRGKAECAGVAMTSSCS